MLNITSKQQNNTVTVYIEGRVDSANANLFDDGIKSADVLEKLIIDIEKMEYMSSAGLRVILKYRKLHPDIEIINASTEVYDVFDMTGFTEMMVVKRAYKNVNVDGCEVIGEGANGTVYRIDPDTVVKVYRNPDSLLDIEHERDVARTALVLGIPTAISYDVVKVGDCYASMFEMLNAKSLSSMLKEHPENIDIYIEKYVELLKLIHATEVPKGQLPDQRATILNWAEDIKQCFKEDVYNKLFALLTAIPEDNHMIHGDYHTKNIMVQDGELLLIDMDTLAVGHPVLELASIYNAYVGFGSLNKNDVQDFLGLDYAVVSAVWEKTLSLYYNTTNADIIAYREKQAKTIGLIRILRRTIRRDKSQDLINYCVSELTELSTELNSLT